MDKIAENTILILSGVPCIGKTSAAHNIIQKYPVFQRVSEIDIITAVVRAVLDDLIDKGILARDEVDKHYSELYKSLTVSDLYTTKLQSQKLIPYIKEIILHQQSRKIPTIIEGAGIIPSLFFPNGKPLEWLNSSIVFVNMYISDTQQQKERRSSRYNEREYSNAYDDIIRREEFVINEKNLSLHSEALSLSATQPNVFSIDTAYLTSEETAKKIADIVFSYFSQRL